MKLTHINVDGFGVWSGLDLADLSPQATVLYGPNEAGKTTLLQFIRAMLYGFTAERRSKYLPPVRGDATGGVLGVATSDEGLLRVHRAENSKLGLGEVTIKLADGTVQGRAQLRRLLRDVDEATFNNVFALGIDELQELRALNDTDAAQWLYTISAGLDRVPLEQVLQGLEASRSRIVHTSAGPSAVRDLLAERDELRRQVDELSQLVHESERLLTQRKGCQGQLADFDRELAVRQAEYRHLETAIRVFNPWQRRTELDAQISAIGGHEQWPGDAPARMKRLNLKVRRSRRQGRRLAWRRARLVSQAKDMAEGGTLCKCAARVEALLEQEPWIAVAEQDLQRVETAVAQWSEKWRIDEGRFLSLLRPGVSVGQSIGQAGSSQPVLPLDDAAIHTLRRPAKVVKRAAVRLKKARRQLAQQQAEVQRCRQQIVGAGGIAVSEDVTAAVAAAGERVSQLRRRLQIDQRLEQSAQTASELRQQVAELAKRQILPSGLLVTLGVAFVVGVTLLLGGLLLPASITGAWGWPMAGLGLVLVGSAVAAKYGIEHSVAAQLTVTQKQLSLLDSQSREAETEMAALDRSLGSNRESLSQRLQAAEKELSKLEELLPLEAQRQAAEKLALMYASTVEETRGRHRSARRSWRDALTSVGLPSALKPSGLRAVAVAGGELAASRRRLEEAQAELTRRRGELSGVSRRIEELLQTAGVIPESSGASQRLRQLRRQLAEQQETHQRHEVVKRQLKVLWRKSRITKRRWRTARNRRQALLDRCGVKDIREFRRRAEEIAALEVVVADRQAVGRQIEAITAQVCDEAVIARVISGRSLGELNAQLVESARRVEAIAHQQRQIAEQIGRIREQIGKLAHDRRPAERRFALAQAEEKLAAAVRRWQVLTITHRLLLAIQEDYRKNRQPETLREASGYLNQLTAGRYARVWTPLGESTLKVDDAEGRSLSVDVLSRGAREQLFLSLRLALVGLYARRGTALPLVLDDVLVNFDAQRAAAAIDVLRDFAQRGHQLILFTCHEHIAAALRRQRFDVRRLPENDEPGSAAPFLLDEQSAARRSRLRRSREGVVAAAVELAEEPPVVSPAADSVPELCVTIVDSGAPGQAVLSNGREAPQSLRVDPPHQPARVRDPRQVSPRRLLDDQPTPIIIDASTNGDEAGP